MMTHSTMKRITSGMSLGSIVGDMDYDLFMKTCRRVSGSVISVASVKHGAMDDLAVNIYQSTRTRLTEAK